MHKLKTENWKRIPQDLFLPFICPGPHLSAEVSGLLAHTIYGNIQGIASLCLVSLQAMGQKTISGCLGSLSKHSVCVPSASEHLVNRTC